MEREYCIGKGEEVVYWQARGVLYWQKGRVLYWQGRGSTDGKGVLDLQGIGSNVLAREYWIYKG